jgi:hypothetical protein
VTCGATSTKSAARATSAVKLEGVPRIVTFRIGPIWVAAHLNDYGEVVGPRLGLTCEHARMRVLRHT